MPARYWSATTAIIWGDPMLRTKTADRIVIFATVFMLIAAVCLWGQVENVRGDGSHEIGYESLLFDTSRVHTIGITMANWDDFIASAAAEEYRECDITIDGERIGTVGIRAKGNTSLSSVATLGSSRYSFKVEFDQYAKGKTYHGLDKLSLNNLIQDTTMMKDYLAYTLMGRMGVPSPLCSYAQITVNGEPWGLYLAVEAVEDSFLDRNGMTKGELYKPDSMSFGGGRGNGRDFDIENFREKDEESTGTPEAAKSESTPAPEQSAAPAADNGGSFGGSSGGPAGGTDGAVPDAGFTPSDGSSPQGGNGAFPAPGNMPEGFEGVGLQEMPDMGGGGFGGFGGFNFGMGNDDVRLIYSDDDPDSYSNIFENAKTNINKRDKNRLINTLEKLNAKEDLDNVVNKDEVITYLAVHNFLCNDDSYTGMMVHNYYLYEEKGELTIIPWDYNLGFGGFSAGTNATSTVNSPIDNPVSGGTNDSRPLIGWIFSDEEALAAYHKTYDRFITECIESGWLDKEITRLHDLIASCVAEDPTAFYTSEEFEKGVSTIRTFCAKRGESIRGQLDGTIPSTTNGQRNSSALIDASEISTKDMGSMNGTGEGGFEMPAGGPDAGSGGMPGGMLSGMPTGIPQGDGEGVSFGGSTGESAQPGGNPTGETPSAGMPAEMFGTVNPPETGTTEAPTETPAAESPEAEIADRPADTAKPEKTAGTERPKAPEGAGGGQNLPGGFPGGNFPGTDGNTGYSSGQWIWAAICAAVILAAILIIRKAGDHNQ